MTADEMIKMLEKLPKDCEVFVEMIPTEKKWEGDRKFYTICDFQKRIIGTGIVIKEDKEF